VLVLNPAWAQSEKYVRISPRDPRYFEYSDGTPYIPNGLNLIGVGDMSTEKGLAQMQEWMQNLAKNQGNYIRLWLSNSFWEVEHRKSGEYDAVKAQERLDRILELAANNNISVKATLEHFRNFKDKGWDAKPMHDVKNGGPATSMEDFFRGTASRDLFRKKLDWYANRYSANPTVFAWELWNEINATSGGGNALEEVSEQYDWTVVMLAELKKRFPNRLVIQSLGSFDHPKLRETYKAFSAISDNDMAQVHRYLDLGAKLEVCHGPVDMLAVDAVKELLAYNLNKPVLLAESGAVEPSHTGPFKLYAADKAGIILHDVLLLLSLPGRPGADKSGTGIPT
jgi:hypothetical protein